jgi:hypothetical protein
MKPGDKVWFLDNGNIIEGVYMGPYTYRPDRDAVQVGIQIWDIHPDTKRATREEAVVAARAWYLDQIAVTESQIEYSQLRLLKLKQAMALVCGE